MKTTKSKTVKRTAKKVASKPRKPRKPRARIIRQWLKTLPEPIRERALDSLIEKAATNMASNLADAVCGAFTWNHSPEGHEYWESVYNALGNGDKLPLPPAPAVPVTARLMWDDCYADDTILASIHPRKDVAASYMHDPKGEPLPVYVIPATPEIREKLLSVGIDAPAL